MSAKKKLFISYLLRLPEFLFSGYHISINVIILTKNKKKIKIKKKLNNY